MREKEHLNEEQWSAVVLDEASSARAHVAECEDCAAEAQRLRAALAGYGAAARDSALRPEAFWAWQRGAIAGRLAAQRTPSHRLVWAGALVCMVLVAAILLRQAPQIPSAPPPDPDHTLLVEVERSMRRNVPEALAPAGLLASEMNRAAEGSTNRVSPQRR